MSEWKTYKLNEFIEINPRVVLDKGNEYSFVEMKDLNPSYKYVLPSTKRELKGGTRFVNGDTLFARITPCLENGKISQVKGLDNGVGFGSTEFLVLRGKEELSDSDFVYYLSRSDYFRNNAIQLMTGTSGRQRVKTQGLKELEISVPDLPIQRQIASILSSLDDKIELNLQMNKTLEKMAQAIFKEWFVDFNFPGFDGELVDGLPKGWRKTTIGEIGKVVTGSTPSSKKPEYFGSKVSFITPTDFKNYGKLITRSQRYLSDAGKVKMHSRLLPINSVIVTCIGSDMGKIVINRVECVTNQQINSIIPNNDIISTDYLYYYLTHISDYLKRIARGGSTMPIINKSKFEAIEITLPNIELIKFFQDIINSTNEKTEANILQNESLSLTGDTILPKIMSGQIEIA